MNKYEAALRGVGYGGVQQPRDVIAALYAAALSGDITFDEAIAAAKEQSLSGEQGAALQENPTAFGLGQIAGNIGATLAPASWATKGIGAAAPVLSKVSSGLGGLAAKIGTGAGVSGTLGQGAVQGAVSTGITDGDLATGALGGAAGAGLAGVAGKIIKPIANGAGSAVRQGYNKVLEKAGIDDLTLGQMTGGKGFETVDSVLANLPFTAGTARDTAEGQLKKFTKAALEKAGVNADLATPDVLAAAENNFNNRFQNLISNTDVAVDGDLQKVVADIAGDRLQKLGPNKPIVESYLRDIIQQGRRGPISGKAYQEARSNLTSQARSIIKTDPFTAKVLKDIRNGLDDAAERSLQTTRPDLVPEWKQVRRDYANYKTIQDAASRVSNDSLEGIISPAALLQSSMRANPSRSQKGYGDLYELARAGRSVLTDSVPNSGTAQRQLVQQLLTGGGVGAGTYGLTQDPKAALMAGAGTIALPKLAQTALNSNAGKQYLTEGIPLLNKALGKAGAIPAVLGAEVSSESAQIPYDPNQDPALQGMLQNYNPDEDPELQAILGGQPQAAYDPNNDPELQAILSTTEAQTTETLPPVNSPFLARVAMAESGGNPNARAKTSSASGMYQFTDPTWKGMVRNYGAQTGITLADKNDPDKQKIMAELLTKENTAAYQNAGIQPNDADLYLAHFLGAPSAVKAKQSMGQNILGDALFPKAAKANQNIFYNKGKPRTIDEVYQVLGNKVGV